MLSNHAGTARGTCRAPRSSARCSCISSRPGARRPGADRVRGARRGAASIRCSTRCAREWAYPADAVAGGDARSARRRRPPTARSWRRRVPPERPGRGAGRAHVVERGLVDLRARAAGRGRRRACPPASTSRWPSEPFRFTVDCPTRPRLPDRRELPTGARHHRRRWTTSPATTPRCALGCSTAWPPSSRTGATPTPPTRSSRSSSCSPPRGDRLTPGRTPSPPRPTSRRRAGAPRSAGTRGCSTTGSTRAAPRGPGWPSRRQRCRPARTARRSPPPIPRPLPATVVADAHRRGRSRLRDLRAAGCARLATLLALHSWGDVDACLPTGSTAAFVPPSGRRATRSCAPATSSCSSRSTATQRRRHAVAVWTAHPSSHDDPLAGGRRRARAALVGGRRAPGSAAGRHARRRRRRAAHRRAGAGEHRARRARGDARRRSRWTRRRSRSTGPTGRGCRSPAWPGSTRPSTDGSATAALRRRPAPGAGPGRRSTTAIRTWEARPDLLASGRLDPHVVVETETGRPGRLRFGDGMTGRRPTAGSEPRPTSCRRWVATATSAPTSSRRCSPPRPGRCPGVLAVTNPLAGARRPAPRADRRGPGARAARLPHTAARRDVGRLRRRRDGRPCSAAGRRPPPMDRLLVRAGGHGRPRRRRAPATPSVATDVAALLEVRRLAGVDVELAPPVYVAAGDRARGVRRRRLRPRRRRQAASARELSVGPRCPTAAAGSSIPTTSPSASRCSSATSLRGAMAVPGVAWVDVDDAKRSGCASAASAGRRRGEVAAGRIDAAAREVLRADSDPSNPEHGRFGLVLRGGT